MHVTFFLCIFSQLYLGSLCLTSYRQRAHVASPRQIVSASREQIHCPTTFALVFLCFSSPPHPTSSLFSPHILHRFSLQARGSYHFNLPSCTFLDKSPIFGSPVIISFLFLSIFVTPHTSTSSSVLYSLHMSQPHVSLPVKQ